MSNNNLFSKVFTWLAVGLLISFGVALYVSRSETLTAKVFSQYYIWLLILEVGLAFVMGLFIRKLSKEVLTVLYILYCSVSGFTLSSVFIVYKLDSVITIFLVAAFIFAGLAIYGYKTKKDISKLGPILFFGLIGILVITFINILFVKSNSLDIGVTIISLLIFIGFIAYDMHIIKNKMYDIEEDKLAIYGAFQLYLDFINMFLDLLRLFGNSKD